MISKIIYEQVDAKHVNEASDLVLSAYYEENKEVPFLPFNYDVLSTLQEHIRNLFQKGRGIAAISDNKLVGFIAGFEIDELFGECKGIYSPLYGHGVIKEYRSHIYKELYKRAADQWVRKSFMTHALTFFTHDRESIDTWFWLGFGLRCVDAIRKVESIETHKNEIVIRKAQTDDISKMANLDQQLNQYLNQSPLFMPQKEENSTNKLIEWMQKKNHHLWVAYKGESPIGFMKIEPNAENFISDHKDVMNITGAYVLESERKLGVGVMLLSEIQDWLKRNKYPLCGVDFESFNIAGSRFWTNHFTPYTYSLVRRIDERILKID